MAQPAESSALLESCGALVQRLAPACSQIAFIARDSRTVWSYPRSVDVSLTVLAQQVLSRDAAAEPMATGGVLALPVLENARLNGVLVLRVPPHDTQSAQVWRRLLEPVMTLAAPLLRPKEKPTRSSVLTERTEELEWLFSVTAGLRSQQEEWGAMSELLRAAVERIGAGFGAIAIPEKRLDLSHGRTDGGPQLTLAYQQAQPHLMTYVQRQQRPLMVNKAPPGRDGQPGAKVLALPVPTSAGRTIGLLAFFKSTDDGDFGRRQAYLARHIARQIGSMLDSQYDLPTGLLTRSALEIQVGHLLAEAPADAAHSLIYLDIDRMHLVNESVGFDAGDEVIARVADLLQPPHVPSDAIASRIAGDRFAVFLPHHDAVQAEQCASVLHREARRIAVGADMKRDLISVSCGIARLLSADQHFSRTLAAAELACKTAKDRGRGRSEVFLDVDSSMMRRRSDITGVARLRAALDNDRLQIFAQKIVPIADRSRPRGVECLVRFVDEQGDIIAPGNLLSAAQRFGMLQQIDDWVIRHTLELLRPHAGMLFHSGIYASINISGPSLNDAAFVGRVREWVVSSGVAPGLITFEITETAAVSNLPRLAELMKGLRQLGCRFALDDFGTGVNSLAYLKNLHVDRVKIDGSFVRDLMNNPRSDAMVRAVVQLARNLRIDCVGEYVENEALWRKLRELGVDYAQGYYVHEPEPLIAVLTDLAADAERAHRIDLDLT